MHGEGGGGLTYDVTPRGSWKQKLVRMKQHYHAAANNGGPSYPGDVFATNERWADALIAAGLADEVK